VCLGLTRKVLRDLYNLPFLKVKVDTSKEANTSNIKGNFDSSSKQDYAAKASTFLMIIYEKPKSERSESQNSYNFNIYSKSQVFADNLDSNQQLFWGNVSSEQVLDFSILIFYLKFHLFLDSFPLAQIPSFI
jgi:hypothetical protein